MGRKSRAGPRRASGWRTPAERTVRNARLVGLVLSVGGFAVIYAGWSAASGQTCVDCQLPYLLSAGATGIGMIILGIGVLLMAEIRAARAHLVERLAGRSGPRAAPSDAGTRDETGEPGPAPDAAHPAGSAAGAH